MTQINNHVILSHIDTPIRILFWPASHVAICTIPIGIGMVVDNLMIGFCMSFVTVYCLKKSIKFSDEADYVQFYIGTYLRRRI